MIIYIAKAAKLFLQLVSITSGLLPKVSDNYLNFANIQ